MQSSLDTRLCGSVFIKTRCLENPRMTLGPTCTLYIALDQTLTHKLSLAEILFMYCNDMCGWQHKTKGRPSYFIS